MTCFCPTHCTYSQEASDRRFPATFMALIKDQQSSGGCWLWTGPRHSSGAGRFLWRIEDGGNGRYILVHRLSYYLSTGEWPSYLRNLCGNRLCCLASHWRAKPSAKWKRKAIRGRMRQLTDEEIRNIRLLSSLGSDEEEIGRTVGLTKRQVAAIALGRIRPEAGGRIRSSRHLGIRHYHAQFEQELLSLRPDEPVVAPSPADLAPHVAPTPSSSAMSWPVPRGYGQVQGRRLPRTRRW